VPNAAVQRRRAVLADFIGDRPCNGLLGPSREVAVIAILGHFQMSGGIEFPRYDEALTPFLGTTAKTYPYVRQVEPSAK